jgi:hypothetical protein
VNAKFRQPSCVQTSGAHLRYSDSFFSDASPPSTSCIQAYPFLEPILTPLAASMFDGSANALPPSGIQAYPSLEPVLTPLAASMFDGSANVFLLWKLAFFAGAPLPAVAAAWCDCCLRKGGRRGGGREEGGWQGGAGGAGVRWGGGRLRVVVWARGGMQGEVFGWASSPAWCPPPAWPLHPQPEPPCPSLYPLWAVSSHRRSCPPSPSLPPGACGTPYTTCGHKRVAARPIPLS